MDIFTIQVNLAQYKEQNFSCFFFFRGGFRFCREGAVSNIIFIEDVSQSV